jgi:hypothetical protein
MKRNHFMVASASNALGWPFAVRAQIRIGDKKMQENWRQLDFSGWRRERPTVVES